MADQKQILTLIRDFASEKSQGERRVVGLKTKIEDLLSEVDARNADLENAKLSKETTEQELKGYEVQSSLNEASIQALEARISLIQNEITAVGYEIEAIKNEEGASREEFIRKMLEINAEIRISQWSVPQAFQKQSGIQTTEDLQFTEQRADDVPLATLETMLAEIVSETTKKEEECLQEQKVQEQAQQELLDLERKISVMEDIVKETKELQDLTRQTSELEQTCATLGDELQKRCVCPHCHSDNVHTLDGILQSNEAS